MGLNLTTQRLRFRHCATLLLVFNDCIYTYMRVYSMMSYIGSCYGQYLT